MTDQDGVNEMQVAEASAEEGINTQQQHQVSDKELNFERLRQAHDMTRQEAEYWKMQALSQQGQKPQSDDFNLDQRADDDVPTYGELKKLRARDEAKQNQFLQKMKEMEMRTQYSDYSEVVKNFLPDVLQEDPDLAIAIKDNPMMQKLAYKLAQASPRYHEQRLAKQNTAVMNKIAENTSRPQPANSRKNVASYSENSQINAMSDDDIMATFNMAKAMS